MRVKRLLFYGALSSLPLATTQLAHGQTVRPASPTDSTARVVAPADTAASKLLRPLLVDENDEPLPGVTVFNRRSSATVQTDAVGIAKLAAETGDVLELRASGSVVQEYTVAANRSLVIVLSTKHPAVERLKPVRLLNNLSTRPDLTAGSAQTIYYNDLQKLPVTSFQSALQGRVAGLTINQVPNFAVNQGIGQPGADGISVSLRGTDEALVIIDGIPRPLTVFDLEEIESVTVLKDALTTAMLGVKSSNGALVVTTRKGTPARPRISFTAQSASQQPLSLPKGLDAYNYALLNNEARRNDSQAPAYTDADLQAYQDGSDPLGHPNVDWRQQLLKKSSRLDRYTFSASGGNKFSTYFVSLEHLNQTGLVKESDINKYNTTNYFKSYSLRSNVELQLNSKLSGGVGLLGRIQNTNEPGFGTNSILFNLFNTPANAYPIYTEDGRYAGNQQYQTNMWGQAVGSGYQQNYKRDMLADFHLKRTLDEITPGLWVRAIGSYYATLSENLFRVKTFAVFQPTTYQQYGVNSDQTNFSSVAYQGRTDYLEAALGYDHTFGVHGISAVVLGNRNNSVTGSELPYTITGLSGRVAYNFREKYVLEGAFGLNGSNRYPEGGTTLYTLLPAVGVAWNMTREDFLQSQTWLSQLKLFGSFGLTANDNPGYFRYIQTYFDSPGAVFGTGAATNTSITEQPLASRNIRPEMARKLNLGVQAAVLNQHLGFRAEYYRMTFYDLLMQRGRNTAILGNTYPTVNLGRNLYDGWEFQLNWQQTVGDFSYYLTGNLSLQGTEVLYMDEVDRAYPWMQRTGQRIGQVFGYQAEGLFQSQDEINGAATLQGYVPQPGDIRYRDLNGDGIINQFDETRIGTAKPRIPVGTALGARWKGLDMSVLLQGVLNRRRYLQGPTEYAFLNGGFGQAFEQHLDRWTPDNPDASFPRLGLGAQVNNYAVSSYWMRPGNYARIKNLEIGYTLPLVISSRFRVQGLRVFASGTNLLTFSSIDRIDPESFNGSYPQQRSLNLGLNLQL
ncbi:SusC/RagA family TonB-linked outer membrane protein [Hymenobacter sp.]|jgi:TonB-linked SusC/RagA family outer membrane protein|uniref:SusC/RagA family TonB-linked outer membrane protein n=1 Tax=Hymenobacter sp. TaxID=1898978 RepID=UPI002EDAC965